MQSVTSNAVAERFDKFDYSENEVNTGRKWIDDKPIYTKVVNIGNATISTNNSYNHNISNLGTVIKLTRHFMYNNNHYMFWDDNMTWTVTSSKINISGVTSLSVSQLFFIIEYTKTID